MYTYTLREYMFIGKSFQFPATSVYMVLTFCREISVVGTRNIARGES